MTEKARLANDWRSWSKCVGRSARENRCSDNLRHEWEFTEEVDEAIEARLPGKVTKR